MKRSYTESIGIGQETSQGGEEDKKYNVEKKRRTEEDEEKEEEEMSTLRPPTENGCLILAGKIPCELLEKYGQGSEDFEEIWNLKPKEPGKVMIYGKEMTVPRWQQSYLKDYYFSGLNHTSVEHVPEIIRPIYDWVQNSIYANDSDGPFNQILINGYLNGTEYISAHSDSESQLKPKSCILSISLGETRKFRISGKNSGKKIADYDLRHGDVVVMQGEMQKLYKHAIVKVGGLKGKNMGKRINLTFRKFK